MYCVNVEYKDNWKSWFCDNEEFCILKIFLENEDILNINIPKNHMVRIKIYSKTKFLQNRTNILYHVRVNEPNTVLRSIFSYLYSYISAPSHELIYYIELEV